ncbi:MAG: class I SAM-dependent methyltransferase family protein [Candidatus Methanoplasma sp.]|jgi:tRNA wybutosine-synthesizing protein 2|nr:class I SAM-dependent methyltransferase family protein [Candidatus Methanoplasma sp.]
MRRVSQALVPADAASSLIPRMISEGIADRSAKISRDGAFRRVPIVPGRERDAEAMGFDIAEGEAYTMERRSPQERILEEFRDIPDAEAVLPMRWEFVGNIAILKLGGAPDALKRRIGETYAKILNVGTVCADSEGVSGELRRPDMEVLYGSSTRSSKSENGVIYEFDVAKAMYASGNTRERQRMKDLDCAGETVVDMFAGIGYFTLPLAKFAGPRRVFACEKNPDSYMFLLDNIKNNSVGDIVIPMLGDNRDIAGKRFADRILMGYVQTTSEFLPKAAEMIKPGGMIHYHDTFRVGCSGRRIKEIFDGACGPEGYSVERLREVKSFAPSVSHYVADVRIMRSD